ncbi:MAG: radical SAM protein [Candidatus Krumholzibacteria bacterium]|nr:radical SAM protein [Candidatus Krumholzibacteria bacterium]
MLYAGADGRILDHPGLRMAGAGGGAPRAVTPDELVPLPRGSDLYFLPGRRPVGMDASSGRAVAWDGDGAEVFGVAAFLAPAWTMLLHPAYETLPGAPALPLFAYCAVGFADGRFWTPGVRVDPDQRQDPWRFDATRVERQVSRRLQEMGGNLVVEQLRRCALEYHCRAAQNYFIGRHEAPIPTSIACNSRCVGCISLQSDGTFPASHERVRRAPTPDEIADMAVGHIERVPDGVVSFGQGCEGEPLLGRELLPEAVRRIRARTDRGTINVNTNGSLPGVVDAMCAAGLDAIRVSINSPREPLYDAYYRPRKYALDDVVETLRVVRRHDRYRSINYLVFPGVTDTEAELESLCAFVEETALDLVQMRNLNIDPELYRRTLPEGAVEEGMGMRRFMERLGARFPHLRYGYFNPSRETYARWRAAGGRRESWEGA